MFVAAMILQRWVRLMPSRVVGQWLPMSFSVVVAPGRQSAADALIRKLRASIAGGRIRIDQSGQRASGSACMRVAGSIPSGRRPAPVMLRWRRRSVARSRASRCRMTMPVSAGLADLQVAGSLGGPSSLTSARNRAPPGSARTRCASMSGSASTVAALSRFHQMPGDQVRRARQLSAGQRDGRPADPHRLPRGWVPGW